MTRPRRARNTYTHTHTHTHMHEIFHPYAGQPIICLALQPSRPSASCDYSSVDPNNRGVVTKAFPPARGSPCERKRAKPANKGRDFCQYVGGPVALVSLSRGLRFKFQLYRSRQNDENSAKTNGCNLRQEPTRTVGVDFVYGVGWVYHLLEVDVKHKNT